MSNAEDIEVSSNPPSEVQDSQETSAEAAPLESTTPVENVVSPIAPIPEEFEEGKEPPYHKMEFMHDVALTLSVEIGQTRLTVGDVLKLAPGKVIEFEKTVGESTDITVGGRIVARGEVVIVNELYGVRISEVTRPDESDQMAVST